MMEPILGAFKDEVKKAKLSRPKLPYISNVTGAWMQPSDAVDPNYWVRHLRQTVRFADGVSELLKGGRKVLLEVGFGHTLRDLARGQLSDRREHLAVSSFGDSRGNEPDIKRLLLTLSEMWMGGLCCEWSGLYRREDRNRVSLPTYPFERKRYWLDPPDAKPGARRDANEAPAAGKQDGVITQLQPQLQEEATDLAMRVVANQIQVVSKQLELLRYD
jgi:phthiocerol/phenolphthiocerol synthesis type-I polyketide synthase E